MFQILPTLRPVLTLILSKELQRLYFPSFNKIYLKISRFQGMGLVEAAHHRTPDYNKNSDRQIHHFFSIFLIHDSMLFAVGNTVTQRQLMS